MSRPVRFRETDITRAVRALEKVGLCVAGIEVAPDGTIRVMTGEGRVANNNSRRLLDRLHAA